MAQPIEVAPLLQNEDVDEALRAIQLSELAQVVIDFSEFSYYDSMTLAKMDATISRIGVLQERIKTDTSEAAIAEIMKYTEPEFLDEIYHQVCWLMAKTVRQLPTSWLVKSAPEASYGDPEFYSYLRADKVGLLRQMISKAKDATSKN